MHLLTPFLALLMSLSPPMSKADAMDTLRGAAADRERAAKAARKQSADINWRRLQKRIADALQITDRTAGMVVEELEAAALAHIKGHNVNGWKTPHDKTDPRSVLNQYQFISHHDKARFIQELWSRQTGKDFTLASVASSECFSTRNTRWNIFAPSERQSILSLDQGKTWCEAWGLAIDDVLEVGEGKNPALHMRSTEIVLSNRSRIKALPGLPHTVRGDSANVAVTEADFVEDWPEFWRAVSFQILNESSGLKKVRLISTPNGVNSGMHKLWTKQDGVAKWSRRLVNIWQAYLMGALLDPWAVREALDDPEGWIQEALCQFLETSSFLLPYDLIAKGESLEASESQTPEAIKAMNLAVHGGIDFGRINDPTVMVTGVRGLGIKLVQNITRLKGVSTPDQIDILAPFIDLCEVVDVDNTGPGVGFGDLAVKRWGEYKPEEHKFGKIRLNTFTRPFKRLIFPMLRVGFEQARMKVPMVQWFREDLHSMRIVPTAEGFNYEAKHTKEGHSDGCTALALYNRAASEENGNFTWSPATPASAPDDDSAPSTLKRLFAGFRRALS